MPTSRSIRFSSFRENAIAILNLKPLNAGTEPPPRSPRDSRGLPEALVGLRSSTKELPPVSTFAEIAIDHGDQASHILISASLRRCDRDVKEDRRH